MGKIELETLLTKLDFWLLVFGVIVVVGVGGESIFGFRHWQISRRLQDLQRREEQERQAEMARLNTDAEEARRDAAKANERAAEAAKIAEGERLARMKIEEKLAPRRLTDDQKQNLASRLRQFAGQRLNFFAYSGDTEIAALAEDILAALSGTNGAGWLVTVSFGQEFGKVVPGGVVVEIQLGADSSSIIAAGNLASALRDERISVTGPIRSSPAMTAAGQISIDPKAKIRIVVGKKP